MKLSSSLALLALVLAVANSTHADSTGAILRCDPATVIKRIDGDDKGWYSAGFGSGFKECAIPLSSGSHSLDVCYDASIGQPGVVGVEAVCDHNRQVTIDAQPGHTYRLKLFLFGDWKAWIEDVTESEAGLSYEDLPKKPKPAGSKKDLATILVLPATPEYAMLGIQKGVIRGKWFDVGLFGAIKLFDVSTKGVPGGYNIFRAQGGDTVAFTSGQMMIGSILRMKLFAPCGDFPVRVYEDIPPGKVLYLGHLTIENAPGGYVGAYSDDLAGARAYIDSHHPEWAGRLEAAPFREALTANICRGHGFDLSAIP